MTSRLSVASLISVLVLGLAPLANADTPPVLQASTSAGQVASIDITGAVVFSGTCTPATCVTSAGYPMVSPGQIDWAGTIGTFRVIASIGVTKPASQLTPTQDLNLQHISTTADGTITFRWTDTNFNYTGITGGLLTAGGSFTGSGTATFQGYFDNTNVEFGTGIPVGSLGPYSPKSFSGSVNGPGPTAAPFSMTEVAVVTLTANSIFNGVDFEFDAQPSPLKLNCAGGTGQVGVPYSSSLMAIGGIPPYTYSITSGNLPSGLTLNPATGAITGTPTQPGTSSYTAQVVDSSGDASANTVTTTCNIVVAMPPPINLMCAGTVGQVGVAYNSALVATGGVPPYTFSISSGVLPDGLTLNPSTGAITGTPTATGTFQFTGQVVDSTHTLAGTATTNCGITISPAAPTLACASNTGKVGTPYNSSLIASGGAPPYTFSITSGSLPPGLTLDSNSGAITGTPTSAGSFNFTAQVVDSRGNASGTNTSNCGITISPSPVSLLCATNTGQVGVAYSSALVASGGVGPYTYSIVTGSLPPGLTLNATTGAITGTPTTAGPFNFTAQVTDSSGTAAGTITSNCGITIAPPTMTAQCAATITGTVGTPYSSAITVTGGLAPYTFTVSSGALPPGLTLNATTGAITGTPTTAGPFSFAVTVTDSTLGIHATTTTDSCGITIAPPTITAQCAGATTGMVGTAYNSSITVTGGSAPYTFTVSSGSLPPGLTLNATTGAITGTPTTAGPFSFQVTVTDSTPGVHATTTTSNCSITIAPPTMSAQCAGATTGTVGSPYSSSIVVTGGTAPLTFAIASGSLPAGLTLNASTGAITGTPTTAGPFSFTVKVTDSTPGQSATATTSNCSITIAPTPLSASCAPATTGQVGASYSSQVQVSGGTSPYTFAIASGSLPPGLTLNAGTGVISGIPTTAGPFSFTVKVTDSTGGTALTTTTPSCGITIAPPNMTAQCAAANTGMVGTPYSSGITVTGGTGPYTFAIATGSLPPGLTLNASSGAITGTPTAAGSFSFTVTVTDSTPGVHATATTSSCGITVSSMLNICGLTWGYWKNHVSLWPVTSMVLGSQTYSQTELQTILGLPVAGDASINLAHQLIAAKFNVLNGTNQLTDGGAIAAADAILSTFSGKLPYNVPSASTTGVQMVGIASQLDTFNSDGQGQPGCSNGPATITLQCASSTGQVNVAYSSSLVAGGGVQPYTFSIASGSLPPGLTLNPTTGAITGTPKQAGTFSFTAMVADSTAVAGDTVGTMTSSCSITISPAPQPLSLTCASGSATVGVAYSSSAVASGGTAPYTYSITAGALPGGLSMGPNGAITGTPTASGTFTYSITVKDSSKTVLTATFSCTIVVAAATTGTLGHGDTATIGFWHNKNGQALIKSLNGGATSTNLANWLATQFPYLYGASSTNNMTGKTNTDVANLFMTFFNVTGAKTNAQILAGALATYVTNTTLAGSAAAQYGFKTSVTGTGSKTYNMGGNGSLIGLVNNTSYTILQLLQQVNLTIKNGTFSADANAFNTIFDGINSSGDIN